MSTSRKGDDDIDWDEHWERYRGTADYLDLKYFDYFLDLLSSPFSVLELGCGAGLWSLMFSTLGGLYTGIDFSLEAIEQARAKNPPESSALTFFYSDVKDLDKWVAPGSKDLVWTHTHLQHLKLETKQAILPKVYGVLKPDGLLVIEEMVALEDNATSFTRQGWITFIESFGFKLLRMTADGDPKNGFVFKKVSR